MCNLATNKIWYRKLLSNGNHSLVLRMCCTSYLGDSPYWKCSRLRYAKIVAFWSSHEYWGFAPGIASISKRHRIIIIGWNSRSNVATQPDEQSTDNESKHTQKGDQKRRRRGGVKERHTNGSWIQLGDRRHFSAKFRIGLLFFLWVPSSTPDMRHAADRAVDSCNCFCINILIWPSRHAWEHFCKTCLACICIIRYQMVQFYTIWTWSDDTFQRIYDLHLRIFSLDDGVFYQATWKIYIHTCRWVAAMHYMIPQYVLEQKGQLSSEKIWNI